MIRSERNAKNFVCQNVPTNQKNGDVYDGTDFASACGQRMAEPCSIVEDRRGGSASLFKVFMLPRKHRLSRDRDIQRVWKRGRGVSIDHIELRCIPSRMRESKFTVIVPVKISKRSVVRNKIKRQLRAILQDIIPLLTVPAEGFLFVHAGHSAHTFIELRTLVHALFQRIRLLDRRP